MKLRQNVQARAAFQRNDHRPRTRSHRRQCRPHSSTRPSRPRKAFPRGGSPPALPSAMSTTATSCSLAAPCQDCHQTKADSRIVVQPYGSYSLIRNDKLDAALQGSGYFAYQFELNDFDVASYQIGPYVSYRLSRNVTAGLQYAFNYIEFGHDPYLNRNIVTPSLTIIEPKMGAYTQLYYQFEARQFQDQFAHLDPTTTSLDARNTLDRDGQVHTFGLTQSFATPEIFKDAGASNLELTYRLSDQETRGSDYDALTNQVGLIFSTPLPFWKLKADAGVSYEVDNYRHPNSLDTVDHHQRFDQILNASVGVQREIFKGCSVRVDYNYTNSNSNVDFAGQGIYDYDRHQVGVRLIYNF